MSFKRIILMIMLIIISKSVLNAGSVNGEPLDPMIFELVNDRIRSTPAVDPDARISENKFYVSTFGIVKYLPEYNRRVPNPTSGKLVRFNISNGMIPPLWSFTRDPLIHELEFWNNESLNYYTVNDFSRLSTDPNFQGTFTYYNGSNGTKYNLRYDSGTGFWTSPVFYKSSEKKNVILLNKSGCLMSIDVSDDLTIEMNWKLNLRENENSQNAYKFEFMATPVLVGNKLYIAGLQKVHIVDFNQYSANLLTIPCPEMSPDDYFEFPMLYDTQEQNDKVFYAVSHFGNVYEINGQSVIKVQTNPTQIGEVSSMPWIDSDGNIYVAAKYNNDSRVYYFNQKIKKESANIIDFEYISLNSNYDINGTILSDYTKTNYLFHNDGIISLSEYYDYNSDNVSNYNYNVDYIVNHPYANITGTKTFPTNHPVLFSNEKLQKTLAVGLRNEASSQFSTNYASYYPDNTLTECSLENVAIRIEYIRIKDLLSDNTEYISGFTRLSGHQSWGGLNTYQSTTGHINLILGDENGCVLSYPYAMNSRVVAYDPTVSIDNPVSPYRGNSKFLGKPENVIDLAVKEQVNIYTLDTLGNNLDFYLNGYKRQAVPALLPNSTDLAYCAVFENVLSNRDYQIAYGQYSSQIFNNINISMDDSPQNILLAGNIDLSTDTRLDAYPNMEVYIRSITIQPGVTLTFSDNAIYNIDTVTLYPGASIVLCDNTLISVNNMSDSGTILNPSIIRLAGSMKNGYLTVNKQNAWNFKYIGQNGDYLNYDIGCLNNNGTMTFQNLENTIRVIPSARIAMINNYGIAQLIINDYVLFTGSVSNDLLMGAGASIKINPDQSANWGHFLWTYPGEILKDVFSMVIGYNGMSAPERAVFTLNSGSLVLLNASESTSDLTREIANYGTVKLTDDAHLKIAAKSRFVMKNNANLFLLGRINSTLSGSSLRIAGRNGEPGILVLKENCKIKGSKPSAESHRGDLIETTEYGQIYGLLNQSNEESYTRALNNLQIDTLTGERWEGILINSMRDSQVSDTDFELTNSNIYGIQKFMVKDIKNALFSNNTYKNCSYGVYVNNNDMEESLEGDDNITISDCTFLNNKYGIYAYQNMVGTAPLNQYLIKMLIEDSNFGSQDSQILNDYGIALHGVDFAQINRCNFNQNLYGLYALNSDFTIGNIDDTNNVSGFYYNHIAGIAAHHALGNDAKIYHCVFSEPVDGPDFKSGIGIWLKSASAVIKHNDFSGLDSHGILMYDSNTGTNIRHNTLLNNKGCEMIGDSNSLSGIRNGSNVFAENSSTINTILPDDPFDKEEIERWNQYFLANLSRSKAEVYGNIFNSGEVDFLLRLYPDESFYDYWGTNPDPVMTLVNQGVSQFYQGAWDSSIATMKAVVETYPDSVQTEFALEYLYLITKAIDADFDALRVYLDQKINSEDLAVYLKKEQVKTKTYISEKDYPTAIERLQLILNNPETVADSLFALVDQAYCLMNQNTNQSKMAENITQRSLNFNKYLDLMCNLSRVKEIGM
ncbi:MAG: right-handed parallel beta-helix repeat-containing protein, partial [Candidatus Cloacimonetes bacterium]|nr:right-handed parallel beta-helix repeat-containing protein [Candidatus Cloacimonadota bacterium]